MMRQRETVRQIRRRFAVLAGSVALGVILGAGVSGCSAKKAENVSRSDGDTIFLGDLTLTVESGEFRDTVEPENPQGYYDYYEEHEGYRYYVLTGTAYNSSGEDIQASAFETVGETEAGEEDGKLLFMDQESTAFLDAIGAGDERRFILLTLVKENTNPEELRICYNEGYTPAEDDPSFDYEVVCPVTVPE